MQTPLEKTLANLGAISPTQNSRLVLGDALEVLRSLPTGSVDLVFSDPPYFLSNGGTTNSGGKRVDVHKGDWDASRGNRADRNFQRQWLRYAQRILRPTGTLWVSGTHHCIFAIGWSMEEQGWRVLNQVTWVKPNPPPIQHNRSLVFGAETLIWASPNHDAPHRHFFDYDAARAMNDGKQMRDVWKFDTPNADEKRFGKHPAQKPVDLLRRIIAIATRPGDVVLDPFAGSSTTGVAAVELGRSFVGIEQSKEFFEMSVRRLETAGLSVASAPT